MSIPKTLPSFDTFVNKVLEVNYWTLIITGIIQFELTLPAIKLIKLMTKNPLKHESLCPV